MHFNELIRLRPRQNGRHCTDDPFKRIFLNESVRILIQISLKFVPKRPINNILALIQIMAGYRPDDKPLSQPLMVRLPMHIYMHLHGLNQLIFHSLFLLGNSVILDTKSTFAWHLTADKP